MTTFADRLISRGAGQPAGLPLLKPRPAARFEREMNPSVETEVPGQPPVTETTRTSATPRGISASRPAMTETSRPPVLRTLDLQEERTKAEGALLPASPRKSAEAAPARKPDIVSPREAEPRETLEPAIPESAEPPQSPSERGEAARPRPPMFFDEPSITPALSALPPEPAPTLPSISIGRIDVQFLPQERPVLAQRPEPQRTRGFETYARARRGQPR